jgi:long-chain fatty acid transport protein
VIRPRRARHLFLFLVAAGFLAAAPAFPSGFQIMTQGAKATGMGLAFAAVANDPSAVFYNPAGLGWQQHFASEAGFGFITKVGGEFEGDNPFPGVGSTGTQHKTTFFTPTFFGVVPLTREINLGVGAFSQYGLGFRWDNPNNTWSGRFLSENARITSVDLNGALSWRLVPQVAIAAGADFRLSKVELERNNATFNPVSGSIVDTADVKLNSDFWENSGWGWNAGIMIKPVESISIGAAYRSSITVDYAGNATFTQILTGNAVLDGIVASRLPQGDQPAATEIKFPASINLGLAFVIAKNTTIALEADWTQWSNFGELLIDFANPAIPDLDRITAWEDSWAYRVGVEQKFGQYAIRLGYYQDNTPQPLADVGPILADNDRDGYTIGFGYDTEKWGFNISDLYLKVKDRTVASSDVSTDNFYGTYLKEAVNIAIMSFRLSF